MDRIRLGHGSGGRLMHELIAEHFGPAFGISGYGDSALLDPVQGRLAFTTDSYVVSPLFFEGGNIGELAVYGTVNDLAVAGARPLYLSSGFIIEEGFPIADLKRIVASMAAAAERAGVRIVAGDTKVVNKGKGDGIFINTAGIGVILDGVEISSSRMRAGDVVVISGEIGSHGMAVIAGRNGISFEPPLLSDTRPLNGLVSAMTEVTKDIRFMRDPTRGGLATTLKEAAKESGKCLRIREASIPVPDQVRGACELLGFDPLYVANEGILVAIVGPGDAEALVAGMREHPYGAASRIIGEVADSPEGMVLLETPIGGTRMLDMLPGEQLPRIC
jgi:hydrogenase expression/formation protein HypE